MLLRSLCTTGLLCTILLVGCIDRSPAVNPDPNHTHADFAVWIEGKQLNFSDPAFMSGSSEGEPDGPHEDDDHKHPYLHLHDGNGNVIHRHKPGLTIGEFFRSIGVKDVTERNNLCLIFPQYKKVCADEALHRVWLMKIASRKQPPGGYDYSFDYDYVFADEDKILILLPSSGEEQAQMQELDTAWHAMTDDACLYSKTCPERGEPPAENCVADPAVPCQQDEKDLQW